MAGCVRLKAEWSPESSRLLVSVSHFAPCCATTSNPWDTSGEQACSLSSSWHGSALSSRQPVNENDNDNGATAAAAADFCQHLIGLMNGSMWVEDAYASGVEGIPGTRVYVEFQGISASRLESPSMRSVPSTLYDESTPPFPLLDLTHGTLDLTHGARTTAPWPVLPHQDATECSRTTYGACPLFASNTGDKRDAQGEELLSHQGASAITKDEESPVPQAVTIGACCIRQEGAPYSDNVNKKEVPGLPTSQARPLPEKMSILVVDDDPILRKMATRALRRLSSLWELQEAASGEAAIELVQQELQKQQQFDVILMDQYMSPAGQRGGSFSSSDSMLLSSVIGDGDEEQSSSTLRGTQTVQRLREMGATRSIICGLSANHLEDAFLASGAKAFRLKPFPCRKDALESFLLRILYKE